MSKIKCICNTPICSENRKDFWSMRTKEETVELKNGSVYKGDNIFYFIDNYRMEDEFCGFTVLKDGKLYASYKIGKFNDRKVVEDLFKEQVEVCLK